MTTAAPPKAHEETPAHLVYAQQKAQEAAIKAEMMRTPADYKAYVRTQQATKRLGSRFELDYDPDGVFKNPPDDVTLEMLMVAQTHMGHNKALWNPGNSRYIEGVREGIHIISLETTAAHLRRAARVVEQVSYHGGLVLFVGTRRGHKNIVVQSAEMAGACHLWQRWTPGTITNRDQILRGSDIRVVDELDRDVPQLNTHNINLRPLAPDLVVCLNPIDNWPMLYECGLSTIPTIGIIDTDADPTWVTYQIPANDDR
jgi:ribosomal protein S2